MKSEGCSSTLKIAFLNSYHGSVWSHSCAISTNQLWSFPTRVFLLGPPLLHLIHILMRHTPFLPSDLLLLSYYYWSYWKRLFVTIRFNEKDFSFFGSWLMSQLESGNTYIKYYFHFLVACTLLTDLVPFVCFY